MNKKTIFSTLILAMLISSCEEPEQPDNIRFGNTVRFSGYDWEVKVSEELQGPGPNYFSEHPDDIYIDDDGFLHMKIVERDGRWYSTELVGKENMGYGTYRFTIQGDFINIPENIVVGLFTWDNNTFQQQANSEVDVELAKWGDATKTNTLQYAVQPVAFGTYYPERVNSPDSTEWALDGVSTHVFTWTDSLISWWSYAGPDIDDDMLISEWTFDDTNPARVKEEGGQSSLPVVIPAPGETTNARINFWILPLAGQPAGPVGGEEQEYIVREFGYTPL